jgi:hypothetical protein
MSEDEINEILANYRLQVFHADERIKRLEAALAEEKRKAVDSGLDELRIKVRLLEATGDEICAAASFGRMAQAMQKWTNLRKNFQQQ